MAAGGKSGPAIRVIDLSGLVAAGNRLGGKLWQPQLAALTLTPTSSVRSSAFEP